MWQIIIFLIVLVVLIYLFKFIYKECRIYYIMRQIPGPPSDNFLKGNFTRLQGNREDIFSTGREWAKDYYPIYRTDIFFLSSSNIMNPNDCELVLSDIRHTQKSKVYAPLKNWLKNGILMSNSKKWQHRRKILLPSVHFTMLQAFISIFNDETDQLVQLLHQECHKPYIEIEEYVSKFTLKSIAKTAMGIKLNFTNQEIHEYTQAIYNLGEIIVNRLTHCWLLIPPIYMSNKLFYKEQATLKIVHNFTRKIIAMRKETFKVDMKKVDKFGQNKRKLAMLDLLLTAKESSIIDEEGIQEEVDNFIFGGHDTGACALQFILMILANHPKVQQQILDETNEILDDLKQQPSFKQLQEMKYLERCIKEVLRLYPPAPLLSRVIGCDLMTSTGYLLPKGSEAHIHIFDIHRNSDIYPNPLKFDPDRFLPDAIEKRHPFAYLPFSAGPRNCIGQKYALLQLKSVVSGIVKNFILEAVDTPESITLIANIVLKTKDNIKVRFIPRN